MDDNFNSNITFKHTISVQKPYGELTIQDVATMTIDSLPPKLKLKIKELYSDDIDFFGDNNIDIMYRKPKKNYEALRKKYKCLRKLSDYDFKQLQLLCDFTDESIFDKFDLEVYKETYPDVIYECGDVDAKVIAHYINHGREEGRVAMFFNIPDDFDPKIYKSLNKDIRNLSDVDAKIHYERFGFKEKRQYKDGPGMNQKPRVALVVTARNEGPYFLEWVCYHKLLGFDDIYIYSNDNEDGSEELLEKLDEVGLIHYTNTTGQCPKDTKLQPYVYSRALKEIRKENKHNWMCVLDMDEFLHLKKHNNIKEFIESYPDDIDGFLFHWQMMNSNNQVKKEKGLVLERFTQKGALNLVHTKTLARLSVISEWISPHVPNFKPDTNIVEFHYTNEHGDPPALEEPTSNVKTYLVSDIAVVNHYVVKSWEEFLVKIARGSGTDFVEDVLAPRENREFLWKRHDVDNGQDMGILSSNAYLNLKEYIDKISKMKNILKIDERINKKHK